METALCPEGWSGNNGIFGGKLQNIYKTVLKEKWGRMGLIRGKGGCYRCFSMKYCDFGKELSE